MSKAGAPSAVAQLIVAYAGESSKTGAAVVLRPDNARSWDLALMRPVVSAADGKFSLPNVAPGNYRLIAFANTDPADALDPDLFKDHENKAENVRLGPNAKETLQLKAVIAHR